MVATALRRTAEDTMADNMDVQTGAPVVLTIPEGELSGAHESVAVQIPGGAWFLRADFSREGADLVLTGPEGQHVIIEGYFEASEPPALTTGNGVTLKGHVVVNLAGPLAPGQYAADGPDLAQLGEPIGTIETLDGTVEVTRADGTIETLNPGDPIYQGDFVETASDGSFGVVFLDESTFSLGSDGRITFDEMVYSPEDQSGSAAITLLQGTFSFVSGAIAKTDPDAMVIDTPTATIGIRGTGGGGSANANGELTIAILPESGDITGEIVVANDQGNTIINQPNTGVNVTPGASPTIPIPFSGEQLGQVFGTTLLTLPNDVAAFTPETLSDVRAGIQGAAQARAAASEATEAVTQAQAAVAAAEAAVAAATTEAGIAAARLAVAEAQAEVAVAEAIKAEAQLAVVETSGEGAVALAASTVGVATSGAAALKAATQQAATAATVAEAAIDALGSGQTPGEAGPDTIDSGESGAPVFTTVEVPVPGADGVLEPVLASVIAPVPELELDTIPDADDAAEVIPDTPEEIPLPPEQRALAASNAAQQAYVDALALRPRAETAGSNTAAGIPERIEPILLNDAQAPYGRFLGDTPLSATEAEQTAREIEQARDTILGLLADMHAIIEAVEEADSQSLSAQLASIGANIFNDENMATLQGNPGSGDLTRFQLAWAANNSVNAADSGVLGYYRAAQNATTVAAAEQALENIRNAYQTIRENVATLRHQIDEARADAGLPPLGASADVPQSDLEAPAEPSDGPPAGTASDAPLSDFVPPVEPDFEMILTVNGSVTDTTTVEGTAGDDQFGLVVRAEEEGLPFSDNHITLSGGAGDDIFDVSITGVENGGNNRLVLDGGEGADTFNLGMDNLENAVTFRYDSVLDGGDTITGLTAGDDFHMEFDGEAFGAVNTTTFHAGGTDDESGLEQTVLWFYNADTATLQYDADGFNNGHEAETIATFRNASGNAQDVNLTLDQLATYSSEDGDQTASPLETGVG